MKNRLLVVEEKTFKFRYFIDILDDGLQSGKLSKIISYQYLLVNNMMNVINLCLLK